MLFQNKTSRLTWLFLAVLVMTCACTRGLIAPELASRTYHKPYDEVWEAVTGVILEELGCVERKLKKNRCYLETEWVHSFDTEGQHRWRIEASLKKTDGTVMVQLNKIVQLKGGVSNTIKRYEEKTNKDPKGPDAGWSNEAATARDIEDLFRRIDLRLGE